MKRIIIACDKFKGTLTAAEACGIIAQGLSGLAGADIATVPMADGGEGTAASLAAALGLEERRLPAADMLMRPLPGGAPVYVSPSGRTVAVDSCAVLGLMLVDPARRDPMRSTSAPLGRLIADITAGFRPDTIYLGVGGTGTVDCGAGMMQALGARLLDAAGRPLPAPVTPADMHRLARVDLSGLIPLPEIIPLCDVDIPLLPATSGAGSMLDFAPQKGVTPSLMPDVAAAARLWIDAGATSAGPFTGAGGGLISGLDRIARPRLGAGYLIDLTRILDNRPSLIITGEGCLDHQSAMGKLTGTLARRCADRHIPLAVIAGTIRPYPGIDRDFPLRLSTTDFITGRPIGLPTPDPSASLRLATLHLTAMLSRNEIVG